MNDDNILLRSRLRALARHQHGTLRLEVNDLALEALNAILAADERARVLAEAARAKEREACAKVCEKEAEDYIRCEDIREACIDCADAIRARGQAKAEWERGVSKRIADRIFETWHAQSAAEDDLLEKLEAAGLPEGWNDWWFDSYDTSIEFGQCAPEFRLPPSVLDALWEMGFSRCWVNHTDGMQTYYTPYRGEHRYSDAMKRGKEPYSGEERMRKLENALRNLLATWGVATHQQQKVWNEARAVLQEGGKT